MQSLWEDKTFQIPEVVYCNVQFHSWTVPTIKEAQFIRKVNTNMRVGIRVMKKQVEELKTQLSQQKESS